MKLLSFDRVNYFMHVCAFAELCVFGLGAPLSLSAPGEESAPDPLFFPDDPTTAAPIWVRITMTLVVALIFLTPALWVLTLHLASVKRGSSIIGWCVLAFAFIVFIEGSSVIYGGSSEPIPQEWTLGYFATAGLAVAAGGYLILYSKWICGLNPKKGPARDTAATEAEADETPNSRLSAETRQLVGRLALFTFVVSIALLVTVVLSLFSQFDKQPYYLTIGFFGVVGSGMVVTGLIREDTLASMIPWSKSERTQPSVSSDDD